MTPLSRVEMRLKLTMRVQEPTLDNGVMKSPKRREIISLIFTCLCITKSLLIRIGDCVAHIARGNQTMR